MARDLTTNYLSRRNGIPFVTLMAILAVLCGVFALGAKYCFSVCIRNFGLFKGLLDTDRSICFAPRIGGVGSIRVLVWALLIKSIEGTERDAICTRYFSISSKWLKRHTVQ